MPVLCLEGPSAVGKTTIAAALASQRSARVVPEVNVLFERPQDAPPAWYLDRQAERWTLATDAARDHRLVLLDGDPFQPLWYNWAYGFAGWQSLDALGAFYRPRIVRGEMRFPDRYVVFGASEDALRERKTSDRARRRGGFEAHLRFIGPQRRYFEAMETLSPGQVRFLDARTVEESACAVEALAGDIEAERHPVALIDWLRRHPAA